MTDMESKLIDSYTNNLTTIFLSYGDYDDITTETILLFGKDIAKESFECTKAGDLAGCGKAETKHRNTYSNKYPDKMNGDIYFYFGMCRYAGNKIGEGVPEEIDKLFNHAFRLKK